MGIFQGLTGYVLLAALGIGIVAIVLVAIIGAIKNGRKADDSEDEFAALAEYNGVDGFVAPTKEDAVAPAVENVAPKAVEAANEAPVQDSTATAAPQTQSQPTTPPPETAPVTSPATQPKQQLSEETPIAANSVPVEQRQGDWSNYDGEYDGYYYDPIDSCYYEGNPPVYVQKMYLPPAPEPVVRTIANPAAPIMSKPVAARAAAPKSTKGGLDPAIIYGQYAIGSAGTEYYFSLYSNKDEELFDSFNYSSEQYCRDAIKRFKKHVLAGAFSVEEHNGKFRFVLVRKLNTYYGPDKETRVEANNSIVTLKYYAQTDIVRAY